MKRSFLLILASFLLFLLIGCSGSGSDSGSYTTNVGIAVGKYVIAYQETGTPINANDQISPAISQIRFTISAPDMQTIIRLITVAGRSTITESFDVPVGMGRLFLVECLDSEGNVLIWGEQLVNVGSEPLSLTINLDHDAFPPVFSGLSTITEVTATTMVLNWSPATDNMTAQAKIQYLIYRATSPAGEDFTNQTYVALSPGDTSYTVRDLQPATTYYFVVRAMDEQGNIDDNKVEKSATTHSGVDKDPPLFSGLSTITGITTNSMVLNWSPATDNVTAQAKIQYLIYPATLPTGENFAKSTFTSSPGVTSYTVINLNCATTYYFIVRAIDEQGNVDGNTVEKSATTILVSSAISGTVTSGGEGLPGVTMTLSGTANATTTTDASGNYSFSGLANGSYTITPSYAYGTGYYASFDLSNVTVTVNCGSVTSVNFTTANYAISGTVGLAGVTMTLSGTANATTTTNASGNYSFSGLANGSYTVTPSHCGYSFTPLSTPVSVNGADVTSVNFTSTLLFNYTISGKVYHGTGESRTGWGGVTIKLSGDANRRTTTDELGNYSFSGLANGSYTITPSYAYEPGSYASFNPSNVTVTVNCADVPKVHFFELLPP